MDGFRREGTRISQMCCWPHITQRQQHRERGKRLSHTEEGRGIERQQQHIVWISDIRMDSGPAPPLTDKERERSNGACIPARSQAVQQLASTQQLFKSWEKQIPFPLGDCWKQLRQARRRRRWRPLFERSPAKYRVAQETKRRGGASSLWHHGQHHLFDSCELLWETCVKNDLFGGFQKGGEEDYWQKEMFLFSFLFTSSIVFLFL